MGTYVHIVAVDPARGCLGRARARILELESRWSRFMPSSELSQVNRADGHPVLVSPDTFELVSLAVDAWWRTQGRFDPTVLAALLAAGYDRSFEQITSTSADAASRRDAGGPSPGCAGVDLDPVLRAVRLPPGASLDLGGIAKGRTADLVAGELLQAGVAGACVNVGGDVAMMGTPPHGDTWSVAIDDCLEPGVDLCHLRVPAGGIATSTPRLRTWKQGDQVRHHLIDPTTGAPANTGIAAVTVVAQTAAWAEVLAKVAYLAGYPAALDELADAGGHGLLLLDSGEIAATDGIASALASCGAAR
jgi:thiamine biosynthesis lipoprotein